MPDGVQKAEARHPRIVLLLKIALIAALVTATVLAIAQDQQTVELRSAISAEDPGAPDYLSTLVAADLVDGNTYDVLVNGDQVFPAMLEHVTGSPRLGDAGLDLVVKTRDTIAPLADLRPTPWAEEYVRFE